MFNAFKRYWDITIACALAVVLTRAMEPDFLKDVTAELITFFGIQSAVALPSMIFTAGMLRPDGLTIADVRRYLSALRMQMHFWIVLLMLDLSASGATIVGKAAGWKLVIRLPHVAWQPDASWFFVFVLILCGSLAALRTFSVVSGILSLLELNGELTEKAIVLRNHEKVELGERRTPSPNFQTPEGYGQIMTRRSPPN
jgi:hypothetical protein